jgi:hypothetical protein
MEMSDMEQSDLYLLQHVPPYHLQAISKARQIALPVSTPGAASIGDSALAELGEQLFDPAACREIVRGLDATDLTILRELTACGGRANSRDLALYLSSAGLVAAGKSRPEAISTSIPASPASPTFPPDPSRAHTPRAPQYPSPHPHGIFEQAVHRLLTLGLLFWSRQTSFAGRDYANGVYDGLLIVPQAVMEAVESIEAEQREQAEPEPGANDAKSKPVMLSDEVHRLQRALYLYWSLAAAQRDGLPLVSSKLLSRPALRQVVEQLTDLNVEQIRIEADVPRLLFIRLLMMRLGLLYERNGSIYPAPVETVADYFALPLVERTRRCYRLWLESPFWNELNYLPGVVLRPAPAPIDAAHAEVVRARAMVMQQILQAQVGSPLALSTFIARARLHVPYLLFLRDFGARSERYSIGGNPYGLDFRLKHGWLTHREGWYLVEGGFIRAVLSGPLRWLGLVELDEEADTFMPLPSLALIAQEDGDDVPDTQNETWGRLVVQPNFEMVALAPVSELLLLHLDRFAERVRLEQIAQYRLTRAGVTRAVQAGLSAEDMLHVLEQAAGGTIPQNVYYSLKEWERYARRVELWPHITLIEVENEALLDACYTDEALRPLLGRRFSPTLAEVAADRVDLLQELLWERDLLAALAPAPAYANLLESGGRMPPHEAQWRLLEQGLLQPRYPVLNLYLAAELERFTVPDEATGWRRITPASIRQARDNGIAFDAIARFLQRYCQGGVPASFLIRLKMWGGGYQQQAVVQVESAPLLRLSPGALRDIQADEELGKLLGDEISPESRLVHVDPGALPRVLELLRERGFAVEE